MSVSDKSDAEMSRIRGTRNKKLSSARHACTTRLPAQGRRYRDCRTRGSCAAWIAAVGLEESTLRLRAEQNPRRQRHEAEHDNSLEHDRARGQVEIPDVRK